MTTTSCPSFIDLASFAQNAQTGGDPFGADAQSLPLRGGPVALHAVALAASSGEAMTQTGDTFMIVAEGMVTLTIAGTAQVLAKGEALVISGPQAFHWAATGPARLVTMLYQGGAQQPASVTPINTATTRAPSGAPLAELLVGPTPQCHNHTQFLSGDGEFMVGVWDSSPYHRRAMVYRHFELMCLLEGSVTFIDAQAREGHFRQGDLFLVEQHASCSWESRENVTKIFAIYRPAA